MSSLEPRQERIAAKIAASQDRLDRSSSTRPALPSKDAYPPEDYRSLVAEYPWLAVAAGLGLGLLAGALAPKKAGGKLGKRALRLAIPAGEIGLALSKQAGERASDAGREGLTLAKEGSRQVRTTARNTGATIAREAIKLAARVRK
ncbi:MAG: hypothetical protein ACK5B7_11850 [Novosphingobium sp.]